MKSNAHIIVSEQISGAPAGGNAIRRSGLFANSKLGVWLWWVVIAIMLAWTAWSAWPHANVAPEIPYSTFLEQVRANNVPQVTITGNEISGSLTRTYLIPQSGGNGSNSDNHSSQSLSSRTFTTHFPENPGDAYLVSLLDSHNVIITVIPAPTAWENLVHTSGLPLLLLGFAVVGMLLWTARRKNHSNDLAIKQVIVEHPTRTLADIALSGEARSQAQDWVKFLNGSKIPQGLEPHPGLSIFLMGKPGTGKSLLVEAIAGESRATLVHLNPASIDLSKQASITAEYIQKSGPGIVWFENHNPEALAKTAGQLASVLEKTPHRGPVLLIGETNAPLDGITSTKVFQQGLTLNSPARKEREDILRIHTRSLNLAVNVNLGMIARTTTGFNGADLAGLCAEAAGRARKNNHAQVTMPDFEEAFDHTLLASGPQPMLNEHERRATAYHQCGHAMIAWLTADANPQPTISLVPCDLPEFLHPSISKDESAVLRKSQLMAALTVLMGGRAAEEIGVEEFTTNDESDLKQATWLAQGMITRLGMGSFGPVSLVVKPETSAPRGQTLQPNSEETLARIDREVQDLLNERYAAARQVLAANRDTLEKMVETLLIDETMDRAVITRILGPRPVGSPAENYSPITVVDLQNRSTMA